MYRKLSLFVVAVLLAAPLPSPAQKKPPEIKLPEGVELLRDVEYGKGGDRALKIHILRPKDTPREPMPVAVWVHGGGWHAGNKDSGIGLLATYAARGYFCASVEYRFSTEAPFPAQIEDCKCAIRYLRAHAKKYHLDPDRIGVFGGSAGGHLVALLGTTAHVKELEGKGGWAEFPSRVQAVCDICGPTDLTRYPDKGYANKAITDLLGGSPKDKKDLAARANPITHVTKDAPPFLLVHGDKDDLVPLEQSELLRDALTKAGVPVTLYVAKGVGHSIGGPDIQRRIAEFFDTTLKVAPAKK
jgi:acetyl esterase/lipase